MEGRMDRMDAAERQELHLAALEWRERKLASSEFRRLAAAGDKLDKARQHLTLMADALRRGRPWADDWEATLRAIEAMTL